MHTRVSAYALAVHDDRILLTQLAPRCYNAGHWTLPGGGMDFGEQPVETVVREVYEESGLTVTDVSLAHARSFSENTERGEYMAVQLIYRGHARGEPRVMEEGGSTAAVAWVPIADVAAMDHVPLVDAALALISGSTPA